MPEGLSMSNACLMWYAIFKICNLPIILHIAGYDLRTMPCCLFICILNNKNSIRWCLWLNIKGTKMYILVFLKEICAVYCICVCAYIDKHTKRHKLVLFIYHRRILQCTKYIRDNIILDMLSITLQWTRLCLI